MTVVKVEMTGEDTKDQVSMVLKGLEYSVLNLFADFLISRRGHRLVTRKILPTIFSNKFDRHFFPRVWSYTNSGNSPRLFRSGYYQRRGSKTNHGRGQSSDCHVFFVQEKDYNEEIENWENIGK